MKLSLFLSGVSVLSSNFDPDSLDANGISTDSRTVRPGELFICLDGTSFDGADYISEASAAGACAVVVRRGKRVPDGVRYLEVASTRYCAAQIWNNFCFRPADGMNIIAVTGTNGKTTTSFILEVLLRSVGVRTGLIGTVGAKIDGKPVDIGHGSEIDSAACAMTTPDPKYLYGALRMMRDAGCEYVVIEASSHALHQRKLDPLRPKLSLFTNLSPEHLDYHFTMEAYAKAKAHLFELSEAGIMNGDDPYSHHIASLLPNCPIKFLSEKQRADFTVESPVLRGLSGVSFDLLSEHGKVHADVALPGYFNITDSALAASAALSLGAECGDVEKALGLVGQIDGRMERLYNGKFTVIRDFAHTAAALEGALSVVRECTRGRVICVFGCGGDRDKSKRAPMGECATRLADISVVTSDNPRTENPISIIEDILRGVHRDSDYTVVPNRREAIACALSIAREGDTVMLCGKGHENYEIDSSGKHPFDERSVVAELTEKNKRQN